jgi:hypothetical protein
MATIANQQWISIRNIIIYLETRYRPNRRLFVFWRPFWIQNGRHSKPKWSPYGAACLTSCKYSFPLKSFHFWIFNDFFYFYIGGHFENSKTWMHLLRWGSTFLWSLVKIGSSVSENLVGQNRGKNKRKNNNNNSTLYQNAVFWLVDERGIFYQFFFFSAFPPLPECLPKNILVR